MLCFLTRHQTFCGTCRCRSPSDKLQGSSVSLLRDRGPWRSCGRKELLLKAKGLCLRVPWDWVSILTPPCPPPWDLRQGTQTLRPRFAPLTNVDNDRASPHTVLRPCVPLPHQSWLFMPVKCTVHSKCSRNISYCDSPGTSLSLTASFLSFPTAGTFSWWSLPAWSC